MLFSEYNQGDVYSHLFSTENEKEVSCKVGMATAAAIYRLQEGSNQVKSHFSAVNKE